MCIQKIWLFKVCTQFHNKYLILSISSVENYKSLKLSIKLLMKLNNNEVFMEKFVVKLVVGSVTRNSFRLRNHILNWNLIKPGLSKGFLYEHKWKVFSSQVFLKRVFENHFMIFFKIKVYLKFLYFKIFFIFLK